MKSGTGNYLANLVLFPGGWAAGGASWVQPRAAAAAAGVVAGLHLLLLVPPGAASLQALPGPTRRPPARRPRAAGRLEFAGYLPPNCQAALIQPVGPQGVLVVGGDTQRGFSRLDQVGVGWVRGAGAGCGNGQGWLAMAGMAGSWGCVPGSAA